MYTKLDQIVEEARRRGACTLAVACGNDAHTLKACAEAYAQGIANPLIFCNKETAQQVCQSENISMEGLTFINHTSDALALKAAVSVVANGQADVLMKGLVSTDKYMHAILDKEAGLFPPKSLLSHVSVIELPDYPRLLCVADVAVIPAPDLKQKKVLAGYLADVSRSLGVKRPRIAAIAPSEQVLPAIESSADGAILAKMADRGQLGDILLDGPLSLDVAMYPEAAKEKNVKGSDIAGIADCLLFPNIESGNVFFKAASHFGNAQIAAMVVGTSVPCVLTSRGDTTQTKLYSIALANINRKN